MFPLDASTEFIRIGADVGVVLLLLLLGLEYTPADLQTGLRSNWPCSGIVDVVANFVPGVVAGLLLGWSFTPTLLLGGITYVSSSGIIAKLLSDLERYANRETPIILAVLVIEDIAMAVFLPIVGVLIVGSTPLQGVTSVVVALGVVVAALVVSSKYSVHVSATARHAIGRAAAAHRSRSDVPRRRTRRGAAGVGRGRRIPPRRHDLRPGRRARPRDAGADP